MNRQETQEAIDLMAAFVRGEEIEYRYVADDGLVEWRTAGTPTWYFGETEYRVKPKLKQAWANVMRGDGREYLIIVDNGGRAFTSALDAKNYGKNFASAYLRTICLTESETCP